MNINSLWKLLATAQRAKMKDSIMISLLGGLIGTTAMEISNAFLWRTKKTEILYGHLAGSMIMRGFRTNQTKNFVLGEILHAATGATLGIPIFQLLKRTGTDNHLIKGAFAGMLSWGILYDFGQRAKWFSIKPHLTKTHYSALWHNLLYGVTTAQAIVSLSDPSLFPQQNQPAQMQATSSTTHQMPYSRSNMPGQNIVDESSNVVLQ
ncbi:MAG: hypothetical protein ACYCVD_14805 [Desulfitobacteriaceae bacterium]